LFTGFHLTARKRRSVIHFPFFTVTVSFLMICFLLKNSSGWKILSLYVNIGPNPQLTIQPIEL
jgi:hypothetical protein